MRLTVVDLIVGLLSREPVQWKYGSDWHETAHD